MGWAPWVLTGLQVAGSNASVLGDTSKHPGTDLFAIVKREDHVGPSFALQRAVGPRLPLEFPPDTE
jgi:hypothetical protein